MLYAAENLKHPDSRILMRNSYYPDLNIVNFSHVCIPFSPQNPHYGQQGDYYKASHLDEHCYYGAYNIYKKIFMTFFFS